MLQKLIRLFIRTNGRKPNNLEMILLKQKALKQSVDERKILDLKGNVIDPNKPILGGKNVELTHNEKIDWLVKNVDPKAEQTIPPRPALEAMLKDGRDDLIDHFYEMHTKNLGKPKINIDTSDLKHPELVKKMMMDEKLKPTLVKTEAQIKKELEKQNKEAIKRLKDKMKDKDPEDLAGGGVAGLLGEPTYADDNHRVPYKDGSKMSRRGFLKILGGLATIPLVGKYFKWAKPLAKSSKVLTSVPIKSGADGMPLWFKPLVNKVIKEGKEIESAAERVIVHKAKLPNSKTDIYVSQDLSTGGVEIQIGAGKHGFPDGHLGQPVRLEYRASEMIEPDVRTWGRTEKIPTGKVFTGKESMSGAPKKTKEEFWVEEAEFTGGHPENVKFEESTFEKFGEHGSNFDEVEMFATGKVKKKKPLKKSGWGDEGDHNPDLDMASGGRVPLKKGKIPKGPNEWLQLLDIDWDDMDPDEWVGILRSLGVKGHATGGRVPFDGGGSADQRMREAMAQMIMTKVPGIPESDIQIIVKDINIGMSPEDAQASVKANFLKLYGMAEGGRVPRSGGLAGMLGE